MKSLTRHTIVLTTLVFTLAALPVSAATFTVTSSADSGPGTLRERIENDIGNNDTVVFDAGVTHITLTSGAITIGNNGTAVDGGGTVTIDGNSYDRILHTERGSLQIIGLTLTNGVAPSGGAIMASGGGTISLVSNCVIAHCEATTGAGGGFWQKKGFFSIVDCVFSNCTAAGYGGAIARHGTSSQETVLPIERCTFAYNHAGTTGGAIDNGDRQYSLSIRDCTFHHNTSGGDGGAIYHRIWDGQVAWNQELIEDSTFYANSATNSGGAVYFYLASGRAVLRNCTISGNRALTGGGGGLCLPGAPKLGAYNCTIVSNDAATVGGGVRIDGGGMHALVNTIIVGNTLNGTTADDLYVDGSAYRVLANCITNVVADSGTKLVTTGCKGGDPLLGPLADNGGLGMTHELLAGSPAIEAGAPHGLALRDYWGYVADVSELTGVSTENTDDSGYLHLSVVTNTSHLQASIEIYKDSARTELVAHTDDTWTSSGSHETASLAIVADGASGLGGTITVDRNAVITARDNSIRVELLEYDQRGDPYARVLGSVSDIGAYEAEPPSAPPSGTVILLR